MAFSFNFEYVSEIATPAIYASKELYRYANGNGQWEYGSFTPLTAVLLSGLAYCYVPVAQDGECAECYSYP